MQTTILIAAKITSEKDALFLRQAIQSAQGQGIIIVGLNNCTVDVGEFKLLPDITVKSFKAKNLAEARNKLVGFVKTPYFFFLDHDDLLPENAIAQAESVHPGAGFYVYGKTLLFSEDSTFLYGADTFDPNRLLREVYFPNGVLQWTDNLKITGPWDTNLEVLEDREFWIRAATLNICGIPVDFLLYKYRSNPDGLVGKNKNTPAWQKADEYIKSKHHLYYGGTPMPCKTCGKKKTAPNPASIPAPSTAQAPNPEGFTALIYQLKTGNSVFYGHDTKAAYVVSASRPEILVANADLYNEAQPTTRPGLLQMYKRGTQVFKIK